MSLVYMEEKREKNTGRRLSGLEGVLNDPRSTERIAKKGPKTMNDGRVSYSPLMEYTQMKLSGKERKGMKNRGRKI